jgi:two-component system alkaline phosphatase synthesis response regulator PhoP
LASVLLVSPDAGPHDLLRESLRKAGHSVSVCQDLSAAVRMMAGVKVDILCLDTSLGAAAVEEFCRWLRSDVERSSLPILFVTPPAGAWSVAAPAPFRPDRDDCLPRPLDVNLLTERISSTLSRTPSRAAGRLRFLHADSLVVDRETHELWCHDQKVALTPREFSLFAYLLERPGVVVPVDELLEHVWGFFPGTGAPAVVRVHMSNLRRKIASLGVRDCPLRTLPHRGYCLVSRGSADQG